MINLYLIIGLALTSFLSIIFLDIFAKKFGIFDKPDKFKIHKEKVTKLTGFGLIFLIIKKLQD